MPFGRGDAGSNTAALNGGIRTFRSFAPREHAIDRLLGWVIIGSSVLTTLALRRPDVDANLLIVTGATMAACAVGGLSMVVAPQLFGLRSFTVGGAFVLSMHVMVLLGLPANFARMRVTPVGSKTHVAASWQFAATILASYVLVIVVIVLSDRLVPARAGNSRPFSPPYLGIAVGLSLLLIVSFIAIARPLPLLELVRGVSGAETLGSLRNNSFATLEPALLVYLFGFARGFLLPLLAATYVARAIREPTTAYRWVALLTTVLASFSAMLTLEKSLLTRTVLVIGIAALLALRGRVPRLWLVITAIGATAFPILITRASNSFDNSLISIAMALIRRAIVLPGEVAFQYFQRVTEEGFVFGRTLPYVSSFIEGGPIDMASVVYDASYSAGLSFSGHANASYVAYLWADFGWASVLVGSIIAGATVVLLERTLNTLGSMYIGMALRAVIFVHTLIAMASSHLLGTWLSIPFGMPDLIILIGGWHLLARYAFATSPNTTPSGLASTERQI